MDYRKIYALEAQNEKRILKSNPNIPEKAGIYVLTRHEDGFRYAYIGQAKNLLRRLTAHLRGYQHIDISLKKHGLYSDDNKSGWKIEFWLFPESKLDEQERKFIKKYADDGFQLRNHTIGGQDGGKKLLDNRKPTKGYLEGLARGYKRAQKEIAHLFELHLDVITKKDPPTALQKKALNKFLNFIKNDENT